MAAFNGNTDCVELLIRNDSDVEAVDIDEATPLFNATFCGFPDCVSILLQYGHAHPSAVDSLGLTPLHLAAQANFVKCAELLLSFGANLNARDKECKNSLRYSLEHGDNEISKLLIRRGIEVDDIECIESPELRELVASRGDVDIIEESPELNQEEEERMKLLKIGVSKFNNEPKKGIVYLQKVGWIDKTPESVAKFLLETDDLKKNAIGEYLGEGFERLIE